MMHYTKIGNFEPTALEMRVGTQGVISAIPGLPEGIENPDFNQAQMDDEVVLIDATELFTTDEEGNQILGFGNKMMHWDNVAWNIDYAVKPDDGKKGELMFWISRKDISHDE